MFKWIFAALVLLLTRHAYPSYRLKIAVDDIEFSKRKFVLAGYDVAGTDRQNNIIEVISETTDIPFLKEKALIDITQTGPIRGLKEFEQYFDHQESIDVLRKIEESHPETAKVYNLSEHLGIGTTANGQSIYGLQLTQSPEKVQFRRPSVLFIGQHHAREVMTHHAVIDIAKEYIKLIETNPEISEKYSFWFVPVVNPDGLDYVFSTNRWWRKNRSQENRHSAGVDLNRNYAYLWGKCGNNSTSPSSDVFKGPSANSEVEVKVMDRFNSRYQFDHIVSFHSSGNEVLYPYVCGQLAEKRIYHDLKDKLVKELSFGQRKASSSGEDFEHHYARYGSLSFLLEIGNEFQPPFSTYEKTVRPRILKLAGAYLEELKRPFLTINVENPAHPSGMVKARVEIKQVLFRNGETRMTNDFGLFHWRLAAGTYDITITAQGRGSRTYQVQFPETKKLDVNIDEIGFEGLSFE